jgi:hypothetical protein
MHQIIQTDFIALSPRAKTAVISRTIHMETIHVRCAHFDRPEDAKCIYRSSEFIHRLSGFIMSLALEPKDFQNDATLAAAYLVEGVATHGQAYLNELHEWILKVQPIS